MHTYMSMYVCKHVHTCIHTYVRTFLHSQLTIFVGDINDNVPICPDDIPTIYILNDTQPNTIIGSIIVSDADTGVNAKITYELYDSVNKETSFFDINATTGEIYTIA